MLTSVGKKRDQRRDRDLGLHPIAHQQHEDRALATTGIVLIITAMGKNASSIALLWTNTVCQRDRGQVTQHEPPTAL
jgi:hypothetical protein